MLEFSNLVNWLNLPANMSLDKEETLKALNFKDPSSTTMEAMYLFNTHLLFIVLAIISLVGWLMLIILNTFSEWKNYKANTFVHSEDIEIAWTSIPAIILFILSFPSFSLLYSLDEISNSDMSLKVIGHQWYWSYEISDYKILTVKQLKFSCYMLTDNYLKKSNYVGLFRLLETNKRLFLPVSTHIRILITSTDVLHSWTIPSFGMKMDACPGRLNQTNLFIKYSGLFFGQCSEICGVNHGFMPISIISASVEHYYYYILTLLGNLVFEKKI